MKLKHLLLTVLCAVVSVGAWADGPAAGTYYIQNVESGLFLCAANNYGTRGSLSSQGEKFTLAVSGNGYTLTNTALSSGNKTLGYNLFTDTDANANGNVWTIESVGEGVYTIYGKGKKDKDKNFEGYLAQSATAGNHIGYELGSVASVTDNSAKWRILTDAEAKATLNSATAENPLDASFLIGNPNFSRNHTQVWTFTEGTKGDKGANNLCGGTDHNKCAEAYHEAFTIEQELTGLPYGVYRVRAQGFYRQDGNAEAVPYIYAGSFTANIPAKTGTENSMNDASNTFSDNSKYQSEWIYVMVTDGKLKIGAKSTATNQWCIWDNFQLQYLGIPPTYYLYSPAKEKFVGRDGYNAVAAYLDEYGVPVSFVKQSGENTFKLLFADSKQYLGHKDWAYEDKNQADAVVYTLQLIAGSDDEYYLINTHGKFCINTDDATLKEIACANNGNISTNTVEDHTHWMLLTQQQRDAKILENRNAYAIKVAEDMGYTVANYDALKTLVSNAEQFASSDATAKVTSAALSTTYTGWTWTKNSGKNKNVTFADGVAEVYEGAGKLTQTVTGLNKGIYKVTLSGAYRAGSNANMSDLYKNGITGVSNAYLLVNGVQTQIKAWADERKDDSNPNNRATIATMFTEGKYLNELFAYVGENGNLDITISQGGSMGSCWFPFNNLTLTFYSDQVSDEVAEALINSVPTDPMNADVKSVLDGALAAFEENKTIANYNALSTAINNANTSVNEYKEYDKSIKIAEAYEVVQPEYTALEAAINVARTAYNNGTVTETTIPTLNTAMETAKVADYNWAVGAYTNEAVLGAWTSDFANRNSEGYKSGDQYFDANQEATRKANQTVKLPAGSYILSGVGRASAAAGYVKMYCKVGETTDEVNFLLKGNRGRGVDTNGAANFAAEGTYNCNNEGYGWEYRFLPFTLAKETEVEIGVEAQILSGSWVSAYAPRLFAADDAVQALRVIEIATLLGTVPDLDKKMNAEVKSTLVVKKEAAENATTSDTKEQLNTIYSELVDAISAANTSIANYAAVVPYNTKAEALDAAGQKSYAETLAAYNNGTLNEDGEESQAKAAYIAAVKVQNTPGTDITEVMGKAKDDWTNATGTYSTGVERYAGDNVGFDAGKILYQTITGLRRNEYYEVQFYAVANHARNLDDSYNGKGIAYVYANDETQEIDVHKQDACTYTNYERTFIAKADNDGKLEFGIANHKTGGQWYVAQSKSLKYVGDAAATMTCTAGEHATFCAPFDVTLPEGVTAYSASVSGNTVNLEVEADAEETLSAGTPVILYSEEGLEATTFYGKKTVNGENCTKGALMGLYAAGVVPQGYYALQGSGDNEAFYLINKEGYQGKANRCYLNAAEAGTSARLDIVIEGETGINNLGTENGAIADGKYMQNNKVVIVKNGRKYNVTGQLVK